MCAEGGNSSGTMKVRCDAENEEGECWGTCRAGCLGSGRPGEQQYVDSGEHPGPPRAAAHSHTQLHLNAAHNGHGGKTHACWYFQGNVGMVVVVGGICVTQMDAEQKGSAFSKDPVLRTQPLPSHWLLCRR